MDRTDHRNHSDYLWTFYCETARRNHYLDRNRMWSSSILTGIADIILYVRMERFTGFGPILSLITGILSVVAGFMLIVHPGAGTWAIAMILPIWIIAHCVSRLSHLQYMRMHFGTTYYYISMILNILGLIVGFLLVFRPMITIFSMGVLVGAYLILEGIECIVAAVNGNQYYR